MCGIIGCFGNIKREWEQYMQKNFNFLEHRGPDAKGFFQDENILLGHTRLAIIDLSEEANQPMFSLNKNFVIAFNGEIYNYQDIKKILTHSYEFKTNSDTEVILAIYEKMGREGFSLLEGMFVFVIYDLIQKKIILARDLIGEKPLYYYYNYDLLFFSSELYALVNFLRDLKIDELKKVSKDHLLYFLKYGTILCEETPFPGISLLKNNTVLEFSLKNNKVFLSYQNTIQKIWEISPLKCSERVSIERTYDLMVQSVSKAFVSDVPVALFLSGGLDSSLIFHILVKELSTKNIITFSVDFNLPEFSEKKFIEMLVSHFKMESKHIWVQMSKSEILELYIKYLQDMDFPTIDGFNVYIITHALKGNKIKVGVTGAGGDELFFGYPYLRVAFLISKMSFYGFYVGASFLYLIKLFSKRYSRYIDAIIKSKFSPFAFLHFIGVLGYPPQILKAINKEVEGLEIKFLKQINEIYGKYPILSSQISAFELMERMKSVIIRDADQFGMRNSVEVRSPFLNHQLITFLLSMWDYPKKPWKHKYISKKIAIKYLPQEVIKKPKTGFVIPIWSWVATSKQEIIKESIEFLYDFFYKKIPFYALSDNGFTGRRVILTIISLASWLKKYRIESCE